MRPSPARRAAHRRRTFGARTIGLIGLFVASSAGTSEVTPPPGEAQDGTAVPTGVVTFARVEPLVIRAGLDTFEVRVGFSDPALLSITLAVPPDTFTINGQAVEEIPLFNDGNQVFTQRGIGLVATDGLLGKVLLLSAEATFRFQNGTATTFEQDLGLGFRFIDPSVAIPAVDDVAFDARATSHVVSMIRTIRGTFPFQFIPLEEVTTRYYDLLPDDRDFLLIAVPHAHKASVADSTGVRNDASGIGRPIFDNSDLFGSDGALQQVVRLRYGTVDEPGLIRHEIFHRWAAYLGMGLTDEGNHWEFLDRPSGEAGGGEFEQLSEDTFRTTSSEPHDSRLSDIELYVAGLTDLSEVASPIRVLVNPVFVGSEPCPPELFPCRRWIYTADEMLEVTTDDILAVHGPRIPAASTPRHFRAGLAVAYDRFLSPTELAYYHLAMQEQEKPSSEVLPRLSFREETRGLATLSTSLECDDPDGDSVCGVVDNCPTIPNFDQDPEVCDQRVVDVAVELWSDRGRGSGTVRWSTTHEVNLVGFHVVTIDARGLRAQMDADAIPCLSCTTGEGREYSFFLPQHRGGTNLYIEAICDGDCEDLFGPAQRIPPAMDGPPGP